MHKRRLGAAMGSAALAGCLVASGASAATTYSYFYTAGQNSYSEAAGSSFDVDLYLEEVNSDQSSNSLLADEHGLSAAGVNVSQFSGDPDTTLTGATPNTGSVPTGFDDPASAGVLNSPASATITESTDPFPFGTDTVGVEAGPQAAGVSYVFLGSVSLQASSTAGETTVFTVGVADPNMGSTFTNDSSYDLDNNADPGNPAGASSLYNSAAGTTFSVTTTAAVPEPLSMSMLAAASLLVKRRRQSIRRD